MEDEQNGSELSYGSEARPNTPFVDPFAQLQHDNTTYACTTKDIQRGHYEHNTSASNQFYPLRYQLSHKDDLKKPNLPPLTEERNKGYMRENGIEKQENRNSERKVINSSQETNESDQKSLQTTKDNNNTVTLPKIDTYCISYVRPSTNHGFSYAVSSTELLNRKNNALRKFKRRTITSKLDALPESGLTHQENVYLLFRAPSRACGLNISGLTVRAKPKLLRQYKGTNPLKKAKTTLQTNIVRLPNINEDIFK